MDEVAKPQITFEQYRAYVQGQLGDGEYSWEAARDAYEYLRARGYLENTNLRWMAYDMQAWLKAQKED